MKRYFFEGIAHDGRKEKLLFGGENPVIVTWPGGFRWIRLDIAENEKNPAIEDVISELSQHYQSFRQLTDREYYGY